VGDNFSHIGAGAVIINRSTLTNALNRAEAGYGAETSQLIQQLVDAVETANHPEAADNLNGFLEEMAKPERSPNRLKTWLKAIAAALPDVAQVATAVGGLIQQLH
jgi:hypothetical protein